MKPNPIKEWELIEQLDAFAKEIAPDLMIAAILVYGPEGISRRKEKMTHKKYIQALMKRQNGMDNKARTEARREARKTKEENANA